MDRKNEETKLLRRIAKSAGQKIWNDDDRRLICYGDMVSRTWFTFDAERPITGAFWSFDKPDGELPGLMKNIGYMKKMCPEIIPPWLKEGMTQDEIRLRLEVAGF